MGAPADHDPGYRNLIAFSRALTRWGSKGELSEADGAVLWMEWSRGEALRVGWGISGQASWTPAQPWGAPRGASVRRVP